MIRSLLLRARRTSEDKRTGAWTRKNLGISPRDHALYHQALRHSSSIPEDRTDIPNNERLEFLGDAILDAIVGSLLFSAYPDKGEGFLTRMRSKLVSRQQLNELALKVEIERVMASNVSPGQQTSVPGNALEAVIGAVYLDKGFERTRKAVVKLITDQYDLSELEKEDRDNKSRLLEWGQKNKRKVEFVVEESPNASGRGKNYTAEVRLDGKPMGKGSGHSKKKAEQEAAESTFKKMRSKGRGRGKSAQGSEGGSAPRRKRGPRPPRRRPSGNSDPSSNGPAEKD